MRIQPAVVVFFLGLAAFMLPGCSGEKPAVPEKDNAKTEEPETVAPTGNVDRRDSSESDSKDPAEALRIKLGANKNAQIEVREGKVMSVSLVDAGVTDLSPLEDTQIELLDISGLSEVTDFSPIQGLDLAYFDASNTTFKDLTPLKGMPLRQLKLAFTRVDDLSVLSRLEHLEVLDLRKTRVKDLSPLRNLRKLQELYLEETPVTDLAPLKGLELTGLYLNKSQVKDLAPVKDMKLRFLNLTRTPVESLEELNGVNLKILWVGQSKVTSLESLKGNYLESLDISDTNVADLSALKEIRGLQRLNMINSKVTDLTPLEGMSLSRFLFTPKNITKGLDIIRNMPSLRELDVVFREPNRLTPAEFWQQYDAGVFGGTPTKK